MSATEQQEIVTRVVRLAKRIAEDAPKKQGTYVSRAGVRWSLIHELRATLAELSAEEEK